jgi:folate-dependent phosphoribosylglycinamide formyltransferase PurN
MLYFGKSALTDISVNEMAGFCRAQGVAFYAETDKKELYQWQQVNEPDVIFISGYGHKIDAEELSGVRQVYTYTLWQLAAIQRTIARVLAIKKWRSANRAGIHQVTNKLDSGAVIWDKTVKNEVIIPTVTPTRPLANCR